MSKRLVVNSEEFVTRIWQNEANIQKALVLLSDCSTLRKQDLIVELQRILLDIDVNETEAS